jgi:hypothetical protein
MKRSIRTTQRFSDSFGNDAQVQAGAEGIGVGEKRPRRGIPMHDRTIGVSVAIKSGECSNSRIERTASARVPAVRAEQHRGRPD